jgi:hypothetical protein
MKRETIGPHKRHLQRRSAMRIVLVAAFLVTGAVSALAESGIGDNVDRSVGSAQISQSAWGRQSTK